MARSVDDLQKLVNSLEYEILAWASIRLMWIAGILFFGFLLFVITVNLDYTCESTGEGIFFLWVFLALFVAYAISREVGSYEAKKERANLQRKLCQIYHAKLE